MCVGFDRDNPLTAYPDAWCDECEQRRAAAGEWTDEVADVADIKQVCSACYIAICARNWIEDVQAYKTLIGTCCEQLNPAQAELVKKFELDVWERWDWDMDQQQLVFSHQGRKRVVASVAFVGTYAAPSSTWMWAWGNDSFPDAVRAATEKVKSAGEATGFRRLTLGHWHADEYDGWDMTAFANHVLGGLGAYRTPSENGHVYMVILDIYRVQ